MKKGKSRRSTAKHARRSRTPKVKRAISRPRSNGHAKPNLVAALTQLEERLTARLAQNAAPAVEAKLDQLIQTTATATQQLPSREEFLSKLSQWQERLASTPPPIAESANPTQPIEPILARLDRLEQTLRERPAEAAPVAEALHLWFEKLESALLEKIGQYDAEFKRAAEQSIRRDAEVRSLDERFGFVIEGFERVKTVLTAGNEQLAHEMTDLRQQFSQISTGEAKRWSELIEALSSRIAHVERHVTSVMEQSESERSHTEARLQELATVCAEIKTTLQTPPPHPPENPAWANFAETILVKIEGIEKAWEARFENLTADRQNPSPHLHALAAKVDRLEEALVGRFEQMDAQRTQAAEQIRGLATRMEQLEQSILARVESQELSWKQHLEPVQSLPTRVEMLEALLAKKIDDQRNEIQEINGKLRESVERVLTLPNLETVERLFSDGFARIGARQGELEALIHTALEQVTNEIAAKTRAPEPAPAVEQPAAKETPNTPQPAEPIHPTPTAAVAIAPVPAPSTERRKDTRYDSEGMTLNMFRGSALKKLVLGNKSVAFQIRDISHGGFRFIPLEPVQVGEVLSGQLANPRLCETMPFECQVTWFRNGERGKYEAGVQFVNMNPYRSNKLKQIVSYLSTSTAGRKTSAVRV